MTAANSKHDALALARDALREPLPFQLDRLSEQQMRNLDQFLLAWCADCGIGDERSREVVRVYVEYCSAAGTDVVTVNMAAEFLMWFFALNDIADGPRKGELLSSVLSIFRGEEAEAPPVTTATRLFRHRTTATWSDTRRLRATIEKMFASFFWEIEHVGQTPPARAYQNNREHTVAVYPYMNIFRLGLGISSQTEPWPDLEVLEQLSVEIIYLVNDILSVARDHRKNKQNFVFSLASDHGIAWDAAVPRAVNHLFDRIARFRAVSERLLSEPTLDEPHRKYVAFLASYLEGNRVATFELKKRYFGDA